MTIEATFSKHANPNHVFCIVLGRSGLVHSEKISAAVMDRRTTVSFTVTKEMFPASHVVVYYVQGSGEFIYDQMTFQITSNPSHSVDFRDVLEVVILIFFIFSLS